MIESRWGTVKSAFLEAMSLPEPERQRFMDRLALVDFEGAEQVRELLSDLSVDAPDLRNPCWATSGADAEPAPRIFENGRTLLSRFEIAGFLGAGGLGEVYRAFDHQQSVFVALKVLRPSALSSRAAVALLRNELNTARSVTHPNVCRLHDVHWNPGDDTPPFFSMELIEGETLAQHLGRSGRLEPEVARSVAIQMLDGLSAAHAKGVVHRDLKPGNIMLDGPGLRVVITDFGLARDVHPGPDLPTMLATNGFAGTPAYMAPEQLHGERATFASDIHAAGVVLFEIATGRRPFEGATPAEVAARRLKEKAPSPRVFNRHIDRCWEYAISRCLQAEADKRPQSAAAVRELLLTTPPALWVHRRAVLVGGIAASAAAALPAVHFASRTLMPKRTEAGALEEYVRGMKLLEEFSPARTRRAIEHFENAVRLDPTFAQAMSAAADAHLMLKNVEVRKSSMHLAKARSFAESAVRADPTLAEGYCSLAGAQQALWEWKAAESSYREAIRLKPSFARAYRWYCGLIIQFGRFEEGLAYARTAVELDALDRSMPGNYGLYLFFAERYKEALDVLEPAVRDIESTGTRFNLAQVYGRLGFLTRGQESRRYYEKALEQASIIRRVEERPRKDAPSEPLPSFADQLFALIHTLAGQRSLAEPYFSRIRLDLEQRRIPAITVAWVYAVERRTTEALDVLEQAVAERDPALLYIKVVPFLENLRAADRFRALLAAMKL